MKKISKIVIFLLALSIILKPTIVNAQSETLGDLRKTYESLRAEQKTAENKSDAAKAEIKAKEAAIKEAEADISKAEREQLEAEKAIEDSNARIKSLKEESAKVLLYMQQMQGNNAYLEYVTGSSSMTELVTRIEAIKQVTNYIDETVENLKVEIKKNEELNEELKKKEEALKAEVKKYQDRISKLTTDASSYDKYALSLDSRVKMAYDAYEQNKKICSSAIGKTDDSVKLSDCSKVPVNSGWLKPLNYGIVTSNIGTRWGSYHDALDIAGNNEGTPVYAAAAGRVSGKIPYYPCGGNMLYIDVTVGGKNYTTYYYHLLRFNVNVGDVVTQNTIIGYVGGGSTASYDSCTFGAHLHFGVQTGWYNNRTGIVRSRVITPPGFPDYIGYRFTSRTQFYVS